MSVSLKWVLIASMDVDSEHEGIFNEVYDNDHIPHLLTVPGVQAVTRLKSEPFRMAIAGEVKERAAASPVYSAIYEIDRPEVLTSAAWAEAIERGRWAAQVRPYTRNRSHQVCRIIQVAGRY